MAYLFLFKKNSSHHFPDPCNLSSNYLHLIWVHVWTSFLPPFLFTTCCTVLLCCSSKPNRLFCLSCLLWPLVYLFTAVFYLLTIVFTCLCEISYQHLHPASCLLDGTNRSFKDEQILKYMLKPKQTINPTLSHYSLVKMLMWRAFINCNHFKTK